MHHDENELHQALEETRLSGRCIADIARERGLKPQKLYALRYKTKSKNFCSTDNGPHVVTNCVAPNKNDIDHGDAKPVDENITLEFNGLRIHIGPTVSVRRVALIVAALKSEK